MPSRNTWLAAAVSASLCTLWTASAAAAVPTQFDIPAQSLASALRVYAEKTGEQVVFFSEIGAGKQS